MTDWQNLRKRAGLTRCELAAKLATSQDTVRKWEQMPEKEPALAYQRQMEDLINGQ